MVKKVLKWMGIILGGLILLIAVAVIAFSIRGGARLNQTQTVAAEPITIPTDEVALARGEHLVNVACRDCHGADLSGKAMLDDPAIGQVYTANITGLGETHSDADIVRAIRHAVDTDGRQLIIMPAESFIYFSEEDLGAIIAYLKTVPRTGEERPTPQLALLGRVLMGAGMMGDMFPAEYIDHELPFPERPPIEASIAYGEYLSRFCSSCHGENLAGGQPADPESPAAPNLTPGGELQSWIEDDFLTAMRSGMTPDGRQLDGNFMPWSSFGQFKDDELRAIWMYLETLPAQPTNGE